MPQIGRGLRWCCAGLLLAGSLAACGRSARHEAEVSAAPVRVVAAAIAKSGQWKPGKCLCVGHFGNEAVEDFPAGLLDAEFARHSFLRPWSACAPYYGMVKKPKGCGAGLTEFICSVSERTDLPKGTARVLCHVNGESEAMQKAGYLQDEYDVTEENGVLVVKPVSLKGSGQIHE